MALTGAATEVHAVTKCAFAAHPSVSTSSGVTNSSLVLGVWLLMSARICFLSASVRVDDR